MKDEDVIQVNDNVALIKEVFKDVIHEGLKGCWGIAEAKGHDKWFKQTQRCFKSSFPLVAMMDTNVVVSPTDVELGEVAGVMQLVNEVRDEGERSCILDSDIIKTSVVLYRAEFAILLVYKKEGAGHG